MGEPELLQRFLSPRPEEEALRGALAVIHKFHCGSFRCEADVYWRGEIEQILVANVASLSRRARRLGYGVA